VAAAVAARRAAAAAASAVAAACYPRAHACTRTQTSQSRRILRGRRTLGWAGRRGAGAAVRTRRAVAALPPRIRAADNKHSNEGRTSPHDSPPGHMLIQLRGGEGGDSVQPMSVECLFSRPPLPRGPGRGSSRGGCQTPVWGRCPRGWPAPGSRGLHSSTVQLNVSTFCSLRWLL